ncbi:uncharacterized protein KY384_002977 [Bacidia gigantensis]|uniref:uncharacterized protein n=1 Tax=Bacidia gigantensis TaxID=2732470 RepID=UPI001D042B53|nr:uncharacterized protein KY384_002977 [Bacidia gigantensis]KAG8531348.1 hypothetical protein KY384_002977 [Bacidia gigantensis]
MTVSAISPKKKLEAKDPSTLLEHDFEKNPKTIERLGVHCPIEIFNDAIQAFSTEKALEKALDFKETREQQRHTRAIHEIVPYIPTANADKIYHKTLKQHSQSVIESNKFTDAQKVKIAIIAHIRHVYTDYDELMDNDQDKDMGAKKTRQRNAVKSEVINIARQWGYKGNILKSDVGERMNRDDIRAVKPRSRVGKPSNPLKTALKVRKEALKEVRTERRRHKKQMRQHKQIESIPEHDEVAQMPGISFDEMTNIEGVEWEVHQALFDYVLNPVNYLQVPKKLRHPMFQLQREIVLRMGLKNYRQYQLDLAIQQEQGLRPTSSTVVHSSAVIPHRLGLPLPAFQDFALSPEVRAHKTLNPTPPISAGEHDRLNVGNDIMSISSISAGEGDKQSIGSDAMSISDDSATDNELIQGAQSATNVERKQRKEGSRRPWRKFAKAEVSNLAIRTMESLSTTHAAPLDHELDFILL